MERLDRVLYNPTWLNLCNTVVMHLNRCSSDQDLLLMSCHKNVNKGSSFRFLNV